MLDFNTSINILMPLLVFVYFGLPSLIKKNKYSIKALGNTPEMRILKSVCLSKCGINHSTFLIKDDMVSYWMIKNYKNLFKNTLIKKYLSLMLPFNLIITGKINLEELTDIIIKSSPKRIFILEDSMSDKEFLEINNTFPRLELYIIGDDVCPFFCKRFWNYIYKRFPKNIRRFCKKKASFDRKSYVIHLAIIFDLFQKRPTFKDHFSLIKGVISGTNNKYISMLKMYVKLSRSSFMYFHDFGDNGNPDEYISCKMLQTIFD